MYAFFGLGLAELILLGILAAVGIVVAIIFGRGGGSGRQD